MFVGLDVGKTDRHAVAATATGKTVCNKDPSNDEDRPRAILTNLATAHGPVLMAVDRPATIGALPVAVAQATVEIMDVAYLPGLAMRFDLGPAPRVRRRPMPGARSSSPRRPGPCRTPCGTSESTRPRSQS